MAQRSEKTANIRNISMTGKIIISSAMIMALGACQTTNQSMGSNFQQSESELISCIRKTKELEEGRWAYMGTIAQVAGKFRTYEAIFVNRTTGPDNWVSKAFGGDVGGDENNAEEFTNRLVGTMVVPIENGVLNEDAAYRYIYCKGPDEKGRYEARSEYKMPGAEEGTFVTAKNLTWYSEHGSYYVEDIYTSEGVVNSRRSGVMTPLENTGTEE